MVEFLLVLMPGVLSMLVWRRLHREESFSAFDYLEGVAAFDFAVLLLNVFLLWSRGWEKFSFSGFGTIGTMKYVMTSIVFSVGLPFLVELWLRSRKEDEIEDEEP